MSDPQSAVVNHLERAARDGTLDKDAVAKAISLLTANGKDGETTAAEVAPDRREQILAAATRLFSQKGYHGTALQEIADEVGVTRPSFYYYFKSKDEILETAIDVALSRAEGIIAVVEREDRSPTEKLQEFIEKYVGINAAYAEVPVLFRTFHELSPAFAQEVRARRASIDHHLAELIEQGVQSGEMQTSAPLVAAFCVLGAINWMHIWYRDDGPLTWQEIAALFSDILIHGIERKAA